MEQKRPIFYIDALQSESRALIAFCNTANIDFETRDFKAERGKIEISEEFKAMNPTLLLPFMRAEIDLAGAHAITKYLCETRLPSNNHFYPSVDHDLIRR